MDDVSHNVSQGMFDLGQIPGEISEWRDYSLARFVEGKGRRRGVRPCQTPLRCLNPGEISEYARLKAMILAGGIPGQISESLEIPAFPEVPKIPSKIPKGQIA